MPAEEGPDERGGLGGVGVGSADVTEVRPRRRDCMLSPGRAERRFDAYAVATGRPRFVTSGYLRLPALYQTNGTSRGFP